MLATLRRARRRAPISLAILVGATGLSSCGGGGGGGGSSEPPTVVSVRFVGPQGTDISAVNPGFVPRNAWVEIRFDTAIDPATAKDPNVQVRRGPHFAEGAIGQFHVDGSRLLFDPSVTPGEPRPLGFDANTEHQILIPAGVPTGVMLRSTSGLAPLSTFMQRFTTTNDWIRESTPPSLIDSRWVPGPSDGKIPPNAALELNFSETIAPSSLTASISPATPGPFDGIDARYRLSDAVNVAASIEGTPILVRVTQIFGGTLRVEPVYSWGDLPFTFDVRILPGLRDLAGNGLSPSRSLGPFTTTGFGVAPPRRFLAESFETVADRDIVASETQWGPTSVAGPVVTTRRARVLSANSALAQQAAGQLIGQAVVFPSPLIGADLSIFGPVVPMTSLGRRVLLSFDASELGEKGTITSAAWGPDRNATFLANYPEIVLRMGYGTEGDENLAASFSASYTTMPVEVFRGPYGVAQRLNVGNEVPAIVNTTGVAALQRLFDNTGFVSWPSFQTPFEWDPGPLPFTSSRTLLFDTSAREGNTWQDQRAYFPYPVGGVVGVLANFPLRRLISTFESNVANPPNVPPAPFAFAVLNPDPSVVDTAFTIVRHKAIVQSLFYTPGPLDPAGNAYAGPHSIARTLGTRSRYENAVFYPSTLPLGTSITLEYQGAMALDPTSGRSKPDLLQAITPWTSSPGDCDGYPFLRWRVTLSSAIGSGAVPVVEAVIVPVRDSGP